VWAEAGRNMGTILPEYSPRETKKPQMWRWILALIVFLIIMFFLSLKSNGFEVKNEKSMEFPHKAVEVSSQVYAIISCESQWVETAKGDLNYIYPAYGLIQVQERTWDYLSKKMGFKGDINSPHDQIRFLTLALEKGFSSYWSCARILGIK